MIHIRFTLLSLCLASCFSFRSGASAVEPAKAGNVLFNRDVRPILAEYCLSCHGPDGLSRKADLRLDREAEATAERDDGFAVVKGDPAGSLLIQRIKSESSRRRMPPASTKKSLRPEEIELLERWIAEGARFEAHWSFIAPERPALPEVKDSSWAKTPVDRFILAELERAGLSPAPEADRRTLARRVFLDLTGLPPGPEEVEVFVEDRSPDAYEKLVGRCLASSAWGEHRARYWLDAARYADTHGIHFDNFREMWSYRDWVIEAFNRNLPFDRFTVEQIAGDLLPDRALEQQIASGFNRCNMTTNEGGAIDEEYLVLYARDRTETVAQVWLGLTATCATCHDHKFDPLAQREFYEMTAFFNNTIQRAMDGNIKDTPPIVSVPRVEDRGRFDALAGEIALSREAMDARRKAARGEFDTWLLAAAPGAMARTIPTEALSLHAPMNEGQGNAVGFDLGGKTLLVTATKDLAWDLGHVAERSLKSDPGTGLAVAEAGDFEKDQAFSYGAWVNISDPNASGALFARMDDREGKDYRGWDLILERGRPGAHIVHKWPGDAIKVTSTQKLEPGKWSHVLVTYDGSGKASGVTVRVNGDRQEKKVDADALKGSIRSSVPLKVAQREVGSGLTGVLLQDLRVYSRALSGDEARGLVRGTRDTWVLSKPRERRTPEEIVELYGRWLAAVDTAFREASTRFDSLERERAAILDRGTVAHVMQERSEEAMAYILFRGEYDKRRDPVKPGTPGALPPMPEGEPRNRLGFARWLMRPEHPLTARVTVNRFWQEVFGTGLVRTAGDFGTMGELPSHPALLDWLAVEFRESGWDVKRFFTLLVTSAAYRQSAQVTPEKLQVDPQNRLLSRGPRFRMDAEMVRDHALAASGLLVPKIGGPSVRPYQPDGVWEAVAMPESNTRLYKRDSGESLYRRSLYTFWKRAAPPASMEILNAPNREICAVRRERTNTPLQALVTLNDVQFVEAARHLAQRALKDGGESAEARIDFIARRLLSRPLRPEELAIVKDSLAELLGHYEDKVDDARGLVAVGESKPDPQIDPRQLAAYTLLTNQLMNLDEVLCK